MKTIKIILALTLAIVLLTGCGSTASMAELAGEWHTFVPCDEEDAAIYMEIMNLYEEERAFVDVDSLQYVTSLRIDEDGSYCFYVGVEENREALRSFYEGIVASLYDNRAELTDLYGEEILSMTREEFYQGYAEIYGLGSFDEMIEALLVYGLAGAYEPVILDEGTFTIAGSLLAQTGRGTSDGIIFELDGDTLTLDRADGDEVYTRVK